MRESAAVNVQSGCQQEGRRAANRGLDVAIADGLPRAIRPLTISRDWNGGTASRSCS